MYKKQVIEHLNAQAMYEDAIIKLRKMLSNCIKMANHELRANGKPEIKNSSDIEDVYADPVGHAEEYALKIAHARSLLEKDIDGVAERDKIACG